jgi:predicted nucleic acid-binding protein
LILVDTSVWVDHFRKGDPQLTGLLELGIVAMHRFVVGEIACGSLADRSTILPLLQDLPTSVVAEDEEVLGFIEHHGLHGKAIGYVDVHLLASVTLTDGAKLWTRDKRLHAAADELGLAYRNAGVH